MQSRENIACVWLAVRESTGAVDFIAVKLQRHDFRLQPEPRVRIGISNSPHNLHSVTFTYLDTPAGMHVAGPLNRKKWD